MPEGLGPNWTCGAGLPSCPARSSVCGTRWVACETVTLVLAMRISIQTVRVAPSFRSRTAEGQTPSRNSQAARNAAATVRCVAESTFVSNWARSSSAMPCSEKYTATWL